MNEFNRRDFLSMTAAAALTGCCNVNAATQKFSAYDQVTLGTTGITTSRLGFGTGVHSGMRKSELLKRGYDYAVRLVRTAYERGVRFFDLADSYGSHQFVRDALAPFKRETFTLSTKYWWMRGGIPEADKQPIIPSVERFLKEMNTDCIDLVQLHCVSSVNWEQELATHIADLETLKRQGKIRAHGITTHSLKAMQSAVKSKWCDAIHIRINPFGRYMDGSVEANLATAQELKARNKGIIAMKVLGQGTLSAEPDKINESLRMAITQAHADVLTIGFLDIHQIDDIASRIASIQM